jgi:hypothetical protein
MSNFGIFVLSVKDFTKKFNTMMKRKRTETWDTNITNFDNSKLR